MQKLIFKLLWTSMAIWFFFCAPVMADDFHYVNMLIGDRASSLGGAYTALSDDPSGCYYNPAGIAFAPFSSLSASVNGFSKSEKIYKDTLQDTSGNTLDWKQESSSLLPNFFGLVRKIGKHAVGFSYAVPDSTNRRQKQTFNNIVSVLPDNNIETYNININDSDKTYLFGPSYAYRISDSLSVGGTLYAYYRDFEVIRNQLLIFEQGEHQLLNFYDTQEDWGIRPIIGAIWEPIDKVAMGLSISKNYVLTSDKNRQLIFRDTTGGGQTSLDFSDTNSILYETSGSDDRDEFPLTVATGLTYFASPRLLFTGDVIFYEAVDEKEQVINFALGSEYYLTDWMAIRAGVYSDRANTPKLSSDKVNQKEHVDIYGGSLSVGFFRRQSSVSLGAIYGYGSGEAQVVANNPTIQDVEIRNFTLFISAAYNF